MQLARGFLLVINSIKLSALGVGLNTGDVLCSLTDLDLKKAMEFSYRSGSDIHEIFVQRKEEKVYGYVNVCPHAGTPLNMEKGQFLEKSGQYLMCHTHGALFQLTDGFCVAGPCNGSSLQAIELIVKNGNVIVV